MRKLFCFKNQVAIWLLILAAATALQSKKIIVQKENRPNILFCIADDATFLHFGAYGSKWVKTPSFDKVANEGLLFMNAYTPNAKCGPSRACILTGRNSWQLGPLANHLAYWPEGDYTSVMEALAEKGYAVGYTGKPWAPGDAGEVNGKPREVTGKSFNSIKTTPPTSGISNTDYAANFDDFLNKKNSGEPFCFWYGGHEPHPRYEYGSGKKKGGKKISSVDYVPSFWPDTDSIRNDMLDYSYEIEYFDTQLGKMLKMLEEKGLLENTMIVVTSDNGMPFPRIKGQEYELSNHLPLAIMWKDGIKKPGRVIHDFISFIDFVPTFLSAAGIDAKDTRMKPLQGKSLFPIFKSAKNGVVNENNDHVIFGKERHDVGRPDERGYPIRGIVKGEFLYLKNFEPGRWPAGNPETGYLNCDGSPTKTIILNENRANPGHNKYWLWDFGKRPDDELYNIKKDPECLQNLATDKEYINQMNDLRNQLFAELKQQHDPRMYGNGTIFEKYPPTQGKDFYKHFLEGKRDKTGWVNLSDYETDPRIINSQ